MHLSLVQSLYQGRSSPEFTQISFGGAIQSWRICCSLQARQGMWSFCTNGWIAFLGSPSPHVSFHMHLSLVQSVHQGRGSPEFAQISIGGNIQRWRTRCSLQARQSRWAFCTDAWFAVLSSPSPYLSFYMHLLLVQSLYQGEGSPKLAEISFRDAIQRWRIRCSLQARHGLWSFCTDAWCTFLSSPPPYLSFHMHLLLVQSLYQGICSPEIARICIGGAIQLWRIRCGLQARQSLWTFCTDAWFAFLGFPFPYLSLHMHLSLLQSLYQGRGSPELLQISIDGAIQCWRIQCS